MKDKACKNLISLFLAVLFVAYITSVSLYLGRFAGFDKIMILAGLVWVVVSIRLDLVLKMLARLPKIVKIFLGLAAIFFALMFVIVEGIVIANMRTTAAAGADYVIVLGCQVKGTAPSPHLMRRLDAAVDYLRKNPETKVVVSGGQGPGEDISEAEAMKRVLLENGIDATRILLEDTSTSTRQNFRFSDDLHHLANKTVVVVTSDYHMFRALATARNTGYQDVTAFPCRTPLVTLPLHLLREYPAIVYYTLRGGCR